MPSGRLGPSYYITSHHVCLLSMRYLDKALRDSNMRVTRVCQSLLYSFITISLLTCVVASSFQIGSFSHHLSRLRRSLPGSLITAPEGAVGYYHPPLGPVADRPQPQTQSIETLGVPRKTKAATVTTTVREFTHELRQAPGVSGNRTATQ